MKKIAVLMSLVLLLMAMPLTAYAEQPVAPYAASRPPATPNWKYTAQIATALYYEGPTMICFTAVTAFDEVISITVEQTLQKQGFLWIWSKYDDESEWTDTVEDNWTDVYNYKTVTESGKYRLKSVVTVTNEDGKSEKITVYSDEFVL